MTTMTTLSNASLATVTTDLIATYGNTAKNVITAYRVGHERVMGFMDQRWENAVRQASKGIPTEARDNALAAQKKLSGYYIKGITLTSDSADTAVNKAIELAGNGVRQVAADAARFEKSTGVTTLNELAWVAVPAAQAVSKVAVKIEQQSDQLVNTLAGTTAKINVASVKRITPFKKARAAEAM